MLMSAPRDHMTVFKASRHAQILMALSTVVVPKDIWATARHSASLKARIFSVLVL